MINCKEVSDQASNYIDGNMPLMKRLSMMLHIFICTRCRIYLDQLRSTAAAIAAVKPKEKTALDTQDLVNNLLQEQKELKSR